MPLLATHYSEKDALIGNTLSILFLSSRSLNTHYNETIDREESVMEEKVESVMDSKIEKLKKHFKENWKYYVTGAISVAVSVTIVSVIHKKKSKTVEPKINVEENRGGLGIVDCDTNYGQIIQVISKYGNKLGHPGNGVLDLTTGKRYESQKLAALDLGASAQQLSHHLRGLNEHVKGHQLVRVPSKNNVLRELEEELDKLLDEKFENMVGWDPYD
jgi:hypothetical protein